MIDPLAPGWSRPGGDHRPRVIHFTHTIFPKARYFSWQALPTLTHPWLPRLCFPVLPASRLPYHTVPLRVWPLNAPPGPSSAALAFRSRPDRAHPRLPARAQPFQTKHFHVCLTAPCLAQSFQAASALPLQFLLFHFYPRLPAHACPCRAKPRQVCRVIAASLPACSRSRSASPRASFSRR